jgi:NitT/TauT family transport system substrate-binding protein
MAVAMAVVVGWVSACAPAVSAPAGSSVAGGGQVASAGAGDQGAAGTNARGAPAGAPVAGGGEVPAAAPAPIDVVLAVVIHSAVQLPYYLGLKAGLFAAEGLNLTVTQMSTPAGIASTIDGAVGYNTSGASVIRTAASGQPVRLIAGGRNSPDWQLMVQPSIASVAELRGKRLGVLDPNGAVTLVTFELLAKHGIGRSDVDAINLQTPQGVLAGLLARQVDGGFVAAPLTIRARREGLKALLHSADAAQVLQGGLGTSVQRLRERPAEVEAFLRALLRSTRLMQTDRALTVEVLAERFDLDRDDASEMYDEVVPGFQPDASASDVVIQREIAAQEESTGEKLNVSVGDVADFGPLQRAQVAVGMAPGARP